MKKKKSSKGTMAIVFIMLMIGAGGVYFGIIYPRNNAPAVNSAAILVPTVQASVYSASDGQSHDVQADFTVEIDSSLQGKVTGWELQGYISEIMAELEYDKIMGSESVDYVKAEVKKRLAGYLDEEKLQSIYITNLNTSENLPALQGNTKKNEAFENLFPNAK